jgi:hypothetical protein
MHSGITNVPLFAGVPTKSHPFYTLNKGDGDHAIVT